jgi:hypothetical protein
MTEYHKKISQLVGSATEGIRNSNLFLGAGGLGGAWLAYTITTLGGVTIGNGTKAGSYTRSGKNIKFKARMTLGSTSAITGNVTFSMPVTSAAYNTGDVIGSGDIYDASTGSIYPIDLVWIDSTTVSPKLRNAAGTYVVLANLSSTAPITFTTSDIISINGSIETP